MPVVEPVVNEEKLRQLLAEQSESETLDYKETCDLSQARDRVELAKDLGAMQRLGGYIVIGADSRGQLTGRLTMELARHLDEASLRSRMSTYIPEPFALLSACHTIDDHLAAVIYTGPSADCFTIFRADGQYRDDRGRDVPVFRQGDAFVRHGTASERWRQEDIDEIRRCVASREKEQWRREFSEDLERMRIGVAGQQLAAGPAQGLTWRVDEDTFQAVVVELVRSRDHVPLRLLMQRTTADARELLSQEDAPSELNTLLDRVTSVAALGLSVHARWLVGLGIQTLGAIYDLGFEVSERHQTTHMQPPELWLRVLEHVYGLGGLAVREQAWQTVRDLALRRAEPPDARVYYRTWIRHGLTMAARSGLFRREQDGRQIELSLLSLALETVRAEPSLRPDLAPDNERLLNSLCQFDALISLTAIADARSLDSGVFYTSFARFYTHRTEPAIRRLIEDPMVRQTLFPLSDGELAQALRTINEMARHAGFMYAGWDGFEDALVRQFLADHPAALT